MKRFLAASLALLFYVSVLPWSVAAPKARFGALSVEGGWEDLRQLGAVGDNATDSTAAIAAVVATGKDIYVPLASGAFITSTSILATTPGQKFFGPGTIWMVGATTGKPVIDILADNVIVDGITVRGRGHASPVWGEHGIRVYGEEGAVIRGVRIINTKIFDCKSDGIRTYYTDDFKLNNNTIWDCSEGGIEILSGQNGDASHNTIWNISTGTAANMYGIAITSYGAAGGNLSRAITVASNRIRNIAWEALDTHGGEDISFVGNIVDNCQIGIVATDAENTWAAKNIVSVGNIINGTGATISMGIDYEGSSVGNDNVTGSITGNVLRNIGGDEDTQYYSAIHLQQAKGVAVVGNVIQKSRLSGIIIRNNVRDFHLEGNTISDVWRPSGSTYPIWISGPSNTGTIGNNTIAINDNTLANLNAYAVGIGNYTTNHITYNNRANVKTTVGFFSDPADSLIRGTVTVTSGTGEDVIGSATFWPDSVKIGNIIKITLRGINAGTNDTKAINFKWGTDNVVLMAADNNTYSWWADIQVRQDSATTGKIFYAFYTSGGTVSTGNKTTGQSFTDDIVMQVTGECANASDSVTLTYMNIER